MRTYRALLRRDRLEWLEGSPESQTDAPLSVEVTVGVDINGLACLLSVVIRAID